MEILLLVGMITVYGPGFYGGPLYCGNDLYYSSSTVPWVALDERYYLSGQVHCGDEILLVFEDTTLKVRALDAGRFGDYRVGDVPIVADLPVHLAPFKGLSAPGKVINWTAMIRSLEERIEQ